MLRFRAGSYPPPTPEVAVNLRFVLSQDTEILRQLEILWIIHRVVRLGDPARDVGSPEFAAQKKRIAVPAGRRQRFQLVDGRFGDKVRETSFDRSGESG